jgi:hypothetical protein
MKGHELGLDLRKEVDLGTATGSARRGFSLGREGTFECLELPDGQDSLLGAIPLEALGIENSICKTSSSSCC